MAQPRKEEQFDPRQLTPEQDWVAKRFSKMIGEVLTFVDAALPEGAQVENLKKVINRAMYDCRNEFLKTLPKPYGFEVLGIE